MRNMMPNVDKYSEYYGDSAAAMGIEWRDDPLVDGDLRISDLEDLAFIFDESAPFDMDMESFEED
jgi:hypothetical protein